MSSLMDFIELVKDLEIVTEVDGLDVYWFTEDVDALSDEEVHVTLVSVQCLDPFTGESPIGCNACDLGDPTMLHRDGCPVFHLTGMTLKFMGDFS